MFDLIFYHLLHIYVGPKILQLSKINLIFDPALLKIRNALVFIHFIFKAKYPFLGYFESVSKNILLVCHQDTFQKLCFEILRSIE